jgi:hypothetical protein
MTMHKTVLMLLLVFAAVSLQGCATHDRRDAPWDPKPGTNLFDQIPNEISAHRRCCGHLKTCAPGQTPRC